MFNKYRFLFLSGKLRLVFTFIIFFAISLGIRAQTGILRGRVMDAVTLRPLYDVKITRANGGDTIHSFATGDYIMHLKTGMHVLKYSLPGYQEKMISDIRIQEFPSLTLNILLSPIGGSISDSPVISNYRNEVSRSSYNPDGQGRYISGDLIPDENISPGTDQNGLQLIKRLNGLIVESNSVTPLNQSFLISGMGARYNQFTFNGALISSFDPVSVSYPLELIPAEAIEQAGLQKYSDGSLPADFAGGSVNLKTKDQTDRNFFTAQINGGFTAGSSGIHFYGDKKTDFQALAFPGDGKNLPSSFPTTRSRLSYDQLNIQEQVFQAQQLNNNLAPADYGKSPLNERVLIGYGHNFKLKTGAMISVISYLNQMKSQQINEAFIQTSPDLAANPYPFANHNAVLIRSQSADTNFNYTSQISLIANASVVFGKNKIYFKNLIGKQVSDTYISGYRVDKPDEDSIAHRRMNYLNTQRSFYIAQLGGEHALGPSGKLTMSWQASYTYLNVQNPDERQFLMRTDTLNSSLLEIATPQTAGIMTNTGRLWRNTTDNNFTGRFDISSPFMVSGKTQIISGGIYLQENYRQFYSDLLLTQGTGFVGAENLIAPDRYFPGGVSLSNFYVNTIPNTTLLQQKNRANYTASQNLGAAYVQLESHLSEKFWVNLAFRMESNSQLTNSTQYLYTNGYKNPQIYPVDENTEITSFNPLPSVRLMYSPMKKLKIWGSYFASVNRPGLQELSRYAYYNPNLFMTTNGNPLLTSTTIDNYNVGVNWIANGFSSFSIGGFYKKIGQPVENIVTADGLGNLIATPYNTPMANVRGIEGALKLRLSFIQNAWLSHLTIFADGNMTKSTANAGPVKSFSIPTVGEHTLTGTPDYTFHAGLTIQQPAFPEISVIYQLTGGYISAVGSGASILLPNGNTILTVPDYRVDKCSQLNIQVSQRMFKKRLQLTAGADNLAAGSFTQYQDLNGNGKLDAPLQLHTVGNSSGYYTSGTDNTVISIKQLPTYYFAISYLF